MQIDIRPALEADQATIVALVRAERLNPTRLVWRNFIVATERADIVGAVQIRFHEDGSRELGSLVVRPGARGRGVASLLTRAIAARERQRLFVITREALVGHFERWGFRRADPRAVPGAIRRNYRLGRLAGLLALIRGRRPRRLVILERPALHASQAASA